MLKNPPVISIIVPVYKTAPFLEKCISSILNQTFKDFELILVDDGSPDESGELCDLYSKKDNRIKVIHKENGGLSSARNTGIDASSAEYIGFVDSDDYIAPDIYEFLLSNLTKHNADISICGLYNCFNQKKIPQYKKQEFYLLNNESALKMALEGNVFSMHAVNKLYKKSLFIEEKFPLGRLSEDAFLIPRLLSKAKKVVVKTEPKYYYVHHSGTITTSEFKMQDFDVVDAYKSNMELVLENFPHLKKQAEFRLLWAYMYVLDKMILSYHFDNISEYDKIISILRKNVLKVLLNSHFSHKRKISIFLLFFNKKIYKKLINSRKR